MGFRLNIRGIYMKKSPHHIKHKRSKAIREAQNTEYQQEIKEMQDKDKKKFLTSSKTNKIAIGKAASKKKSHMTSPSDVTWKTEPESIHQEGKCWIKVIQKQILNRAKRLQKKLKKGKN